MGKATFFTGQPIFSQLLHLIPRGLISRLSRQHQCDRYVKKFRSYDHLVSMLYSVFHRCNSIREVITGMQASSLRLTHLGLSSTPRRSTLADANERRPALFFEQLYHQLYHHYYSGLPDSRKHKRLTDKLFIVDSTIITLFSSALQSTGSFGLNGKKKGGIKAHVLMRAKDNLPCFVRLTAGKTNDNTLLPMLSLPAGSIIVMDKGYRNYKCLAGFTAQKVTWVSRLNERAVFEVKAGRLVSPVQQQKGVMADKRILLGNPKTRYRNPLQKARLIIYHDPLSGKTFQFITNNFHYSAQSIAEIYKKRWQIELFFKRIKQYFQLRFFLGDNENAIRTQLWCTLIADLLIKVVRDQVDKKRRWSVANLTGLIRLHLGTYIHLITFLQQPEKALLNYQDPYDKAQLKLFPLSTRGA